MPQHPLLATTALLLMSLLPLSAKTVRVEMRNGVPQIIEDGVPQRPRWFYGRMGGGVPIKVGPQGEFFQEEFDSMLGDAKPITLHFRFAKKPSTVWLSDVRVVDLTDNHEIFNCDFRNGLKDFKDKWSSWPPEEIGVNVIMDADSTGGMNGGPALKLTYRQRTDGTSWKDFHIYTQGNLMALKKGHTYRLEYYVRSSIEDYLQVMLYRPGSPFSAASRFHSSHRDQSKVFYSQIRLAAEVGVNYVTPSVPMPWSSSQDENWNYDHADQLIDDLIKVNPNIRLVPRVSMVPPGNWMRENPDETMQYEPGKPSGKFSISSKKWLKEACWNLAHFLKHCEEKYPDNVVGVHPCGQNTGEWFYTDSWGQQLHGYSPCEQAAFREWLSRKYQTDAALSAAWHREVALATASCPPVERRQQAQTSLGLLNPMTDQDIIDHNLFLQDAMADTVCALAKTVREATRGTKLSVFFYGYGFEFGAMNRMSACGHYGLHKVLESPDIDILCSPISYQDRQLGGSAPTMPASESVTLHNKLWLCEDDTSTHLVTSATMFPGWNDRAKNLDESQKLLLRNLGAQACRNQACWWMDLGATGWFNDKNLWTQMSLFEQVDNSFLQHPQPFKPVLAAVLDETTACYGKDSNNITCPLITMGRADFVRSGVTFGQFLLNDVLAGKVDSPVLLMLNTWVLDDSQRAKLKQLAADRVIIWCHAPGYLVPGQAPSTQLCTSLTSLEYKPLAPEASTIVKATPRGLKEGLQAEWTAGRANNPGLHLAVVNAQPEEVLATWDDGSAAIVVRRRAIYTAVQTLTPELLRFAARLAGCHVWSADGHVLYQHQDAVVIHASHDGPVTVDFGAPASGYEIVTGNSFTNLRQWQTTLKLGDTRVLKFKR